MSPNESLPCAKKYFLQVALFLDLLRVSLVKTIFGHFREVKAMQTVQAISEHHSNVLQSIPSGGGIGNWAARLFGCWHRKMSRPFTSQGQTYRTCVNCGAHRRFNVGRWEMQGDFYYSLPNARYFRPLNGLATR
jgi:hypothetical protein